MGYFSNGSEGEGYQSRYCDRCLFDNFEKGIYCPIWSLHLLHNYEECNKPDSFLHDLIPREKPIGNARCKFFVDRGELTNLQIERLQHHLAHPSTSPASDTEAGR